MSQEEVLNRLDRVLGRLEGLLPAEPAKTDWSQPAFRWVRRTVLGCNTGSLEPIARTALVEADVLQHIDEQKKILLDNTEQFVRGLPANNVLLTGARGTGKSSLIRACLQKFYPLGLRLIEVGKGDLSDLNEISRIVGARPERFIIFCDDLSFEPGEAAYKALKAVLDGSAAAASENMIIYATSNRRHLMPERMQDNLDSRMDDDGQLHPAETIEEQLSLSERFGLWLSFYPFSQKEYLSVAESWTKKLGGQINDEWKLEALQFALQRGSRSGRVAGQFARFWAGRGALKSKDV